MADELPTLPPGDVWCPACLPSLTLLHGVLEDDEATGSATWFPDTDAQTHFTAVHPPLPFDFEAGS